MKNIFLSILAFVLTGFLFALPSCSKAEQKRQEAIKNNPVSGQMKNFERATDKIVDAQTKQFDAHQRATAAMDGTDGVDGYSRDPNAPIQGSGANGQDPFTH